MTETTAAIQRELWGVRPHDWAEIQEGTVRPLYDSALDALAPNSSTRLLDAGCGAGMFCMLASDRGVSVAGYDATPELLAIARERVPDGDFREGDLETLPWPDDSFDVVTGFNSFQFAGTPANALREAGRVLQPDGQLVVAIWGRPDQCEATAVLQAVRSLLPPPPPGAPGPFAVSEAGAAESLIEEAGLVPERSVEVACPFVYPDLETALRGLLSAGPSTAAIRQAGEESVRRVLEEALDRFGDGYGGYRIENVFRYIVARH